MTRTEYDVVDRDTGKIVATFHKILAADNEADRLDQRAGRQRYVVRAAAVEVPRRNRIWRAIRREYIRFCRMVDADRPRTDEEIASWSIK